MKEARLACHAMATRFEFVLFGDDVRRLRAAGEEAVAEVQRLDRELTAFGSKSPITRVNARAADNPVRVPQELIHLLSRARRIWEITDGAFDITVGPLLQLWGFRSEGPADPDVEAIGQTLANVGMTGISLDERRRTVEFDRPGMALDLGAIGKGHALDVAAEILAFGGVSSALLHAGTSTVRAVGADPEGRPWKVAVRYPSTDKGGTHRYTVLLVDEAMSVSAVWGRFVELGDQKHGHAIDPRTGYPTRAAELALAIVPTATEADALSTALLVLGADGLERLDRFVVDFRGATFDHGEVVQIGDALQFNEQATV
jgi:thiamine biosynthesis lipoprotein